VTSPVPVTGGKFFCGAASPDARSFPRAYRGSARSRKNDSGNNYSELNP